LTDLLTLNEAKDSIGRVNPFKKVMFKGHVPLSLCVENLPVRDENNRTYYNCAVDDIRKIFDPSYGNVAMVKFQYGPRGPLGVALVEFETKEQLEKAAAETLTTNEKGEDVEVKRKLEIGGNVLKVRRWEDYSSEFKKSNNNNKEGHDNNKRSAERDDRGDKRKKENEPEVKTFTIDWKPGCVISLKGLAGECDREAILDAVSKGLEMPLEEVKELRIYADFARGQTDGALRFREPTDLIQKLAMKLSGDELKIAGEKVEAVKILEGKEESEYWEKFIEFKNKQIKHKMEENNGRKRKNFGRANMGGRGKRRNFRR